MRVVYVEETVIQAAREWAERFAKTMERSFDVVSADTFTEDVSHAFQTPIRKNPEDTLVPI